MAKDPVCGMNVSDSTGLKLVRGGKAYYFCSEHCLKKFASDNKISDKEVATCLVCPKTKWYKNKAIIVTAILGILCASSYFLPILEPFRESLFMYLRKIW